MKIVYLDDFYQEFRHLSSAEKDAVVGTIDIFRENPFDKSLNNHSLRKPLAGKRSITVDDDLRIIFQEKGEYTEVIMLDVGNHAHVYKQ